MSGRSRSRLVFDLSVLAGIVISIGSVGTAWAQDKQSCRETCRREFAACEDALISHDPLGVPLCSCLDKDVELLHIYRWERGLWASSHVRKTDFCVNGSLRCLQDGREVCEDNKWRFVERCSGGCRNGACIKPDILPPPDACLHGTIRCNESLVEECRSGRWVLRETCIGECRDALCVASGSALGVSSGEFPSNMVERPFNLDQWMFQGEASLFIDYLIDEDDDYGWNRILLPIDLSMGLWKYLQLGAGLTVSLARPQGEALNTRLYLRGSPIKQLAFEGGVYLPDSWVSDEIGALFKVLGKYAILKKTLAIQGEIRADHFSGRQWTSFEAHIGILWSLVDQFYLAAFGGIHKDWFGEGPSTDVLFPFRVEVGFTSRKQVDIFARWGWPDWSAQATSSHEYCNRYINLGLRFRY